MPNTAVAINIQANGADAAAAGLSQITKQFTNMGAAHDALKTRFQEKFSHIGLALFATQALQSIGLGRETQLVISTMNMAITAIGSATSIGTGGLLLLASALSAVVGIAIKASEAHKNQAESLGKLIDADEKEQKATNDSISALEAYKAAVGKIPPELQSVLDAKKQLQKFEEQEELMTLSKQIVALQENIVAEEQERLQLERTRISVEQLTIKKALLMAVAGQLSTVISQLISKHRDFTKELNDNAQAMLQNNVKLQEAIERRRELSQGISDMTSKMKTEEDQAKKASDEYVKQVEAESAADTARYQSWAANAAKQKAQFTKNWNDMQQVAIHVVDNINQAQANAFAKMVVEGQSFASVTAHLWTNIAEQAIAAIEKMIVKLMALWAVEQMTGFGAIGGPSQATLNFVHPMAEGGSVVVDKPTLFLAGEAGEPEIATFTPMSKIGSPAGSQGSGGVQIGTIQTNVYGVQDPDQIADSVGRKIVERIRGMGDIDFARAF